MNTLEYIRLVEVLDDRNNNIDLKTTCNLKLRFQSDFFCIDCLRYVNCVLIWERLDYLVCMEHTSFKICSYQLVL